ncbi:MAG: hypothetical protein J7L14_02920 [Candidatus Diapherotrites archaeon]|nr:hypothetical protein [Candidatus Diapherotrites archaeon]
MNIKYLNKEGLEMLKKVFKKKEIKLICPHCGYIWKYTGQADEDEYVCCPKCMYKRKKESYEVIE